MNLILHLLFFCFAYGIVHSYIVYPLYLFITSKAVGEERTEEVYQMNDDLPNICVIVAAYNEEKVIESKLQSIFNTTYPKEKISVMIGSDASTDLTNEIVRAYAEKNSAVTLIEFPGRTGKSGIINDLAAKADAEILILTDANVIFSIDTFYQLIKHFKQTEVHQVASNIKKISPNDEGIAFQEKSYIGFENKLKYLESEKWGIVMGAEGGAYAIRKESYSPVPPKFFMDDFYITMGVLEKKKKVLFEPKAICHEDVPTLAAEEFKRKVRISIGNFQNLNRYKNLLFPLTKGLGFAFLSHKVLRWYTPFFLILCLMSSGILALNDSFMFMLFLVQVCLLLSPIVDSFFQSMKVNIKILRFVGHFYMMNFALLKGFYIYMSGVESNIWQPTQRNT